MSDENRKLQKALGLINQKGLDGLIIYSRGTCFVLKPFYFYYFSGFRPMGPNNAVVISKSGDVFLLVEPIWDAGRASRKSWIKDVRGTTDFATDLLAMLKKLGMTRVGIAGAGEMAYPLYEGICRQVAVEKADDIVEEIASEKTEKELENIRKTAKIADIGFQAFLKNARVGIKEYELLAETEFAMRSAGADDIFQPHGVGKSQLRHARSHGQEACPGRCGDR